MRSVVRWACPSRARLSWGCLRLGWLVGLPRSAQQGPRKQRERDEHDRDQHHEIAGPSRFGAVRVESHHLGLPVHRFDRYLPSLRLVVELAVGCRPFRLGGAVPGHR